MRTTTPPWGYLWAGLGDGGGLAEHGGNSLGWGGSSISSLLSSLSLQVRTKDHRFESVSHLISYHMDNHLPIISAGSEMCLQQPVERRL